MSHLLNRKTLYYVLSLALVASIIVFRKQLAALFVGYLAKIAVVCLTHASLHYDHLTYDQGVFVFDQLTVCDDHNQRVLSVKELKLELVGNELLFKQVAIHASKLELALDLDAKSSFSSKDLTSILKRLTCIQKVTCDQGSLVLASAKGQERYEFFSNLEVQSNIFTCHIHVLPTEAKRFSKYLTAFESLAPYVITEGYVEGSLDLTCTLQGKLISLDQKLLGKQFVVEKAQEKLKAVLGQISCGLTYTKSEKELFLSDIFFAQHVLDLVPSVSLKESSFFINDLQGHLLWKAENIDFFAALRKEGIPEVATSGHIIKGARALPFSFQGKGVFAGFDSWDLDLENSAEIPLELKRCKRVGLAKKGPKEFVVSCDVDGIDELDLHMIQELLDPTLSSLSLIKMHQGKIKANLTCLIKDGVVDSITCQELVIQEARIEDYEHAVSVKIPRLKGAALIKAPFSLEPQLVNWDLTFSHTQIQKAHDKDTIVIDGMIFSQGEEVFSSALKVSYAKMQLFCESNGSLSKQDLKMQLLLEPNHPLSFVQDRIMSKSPSLHRLDKVFFDMQLERRCEALSCQGSILLEFDQQVQDEITFAAATPLNAFSLKGIDMERLLESSVTFDSNKVSSNTYLFFLEYFGVKWCVLGDMQVHGICNLDSLDFEIFSEQAIYDSEDIIVTLPSTDQKHYGKFHFDLKRKYWDIVLPLKKVTCQDKKFHLPFVDVDTVVLIKGTDVFATQLTGCCEQVAFAGEIHIDFKDPSWVDLKLYPHVMHGKVEDFLGFMSHMIDPSVLAALPKMQGSVSGAPHNFFCLKYNLKQIHKKAQVELEIKDLTIPLTSSSQFSQGSLHLNWDLEGNVLEIKDCLGKLAILKSDGEKVYEVKVPQLRCKDLSLPIWDVDIRLETATLDLVKLAGSFNISGPGISLHVDPGLSHLFGAKIQALDLEFFKDFSLNKFNIDLAFSDNDIIACLDFAKGLGLLSSSFSYSLLEYCSLKKAQLVVKKSAKESPITAKLEVMEAGFRNGKSSLLYLEGSLAQDVIVGVLTYNDLRAKSELKKQHATWQVISLEAQSLDNHFVCKEGAITQSCLDLYIEKITWNLVDFRSFFAKAPIDPTLVERTLKGSLDIKLALSSFELKGVFKGSCLPKRAKDLSFKTSQPLIFSYNHQGFHIEQLDIKVFENGKKQVFSHIQCDKARLEKPLKLSIKGVKLSINPEMIHHLVEKYPTSWIKTVGDKFKISQYEFSWDNHIDTELDILLDGQAMQIQGVIKEGYYWAGKQSIYLQKIYYFLDQGHCNIAFGLDYEDFSLDVLAQVQIKEEIEIGLSVKPFHQESTHDERSCLEIACKYDTVEGFNVSSIEGELFGIEASFRKNPKAYAPHTSLLTGSLKCNPCKLASYFPKRKLAFLKDLGSGYELSGDFFLCKHDLKTSYFKGYFKGRDFNLFNFYFKTLMSEVDCRWERIIVHDLSLSDLSGVLKIKELRVQQEMDGLWKMKIPEVTLQDFRPSFLRKTLNQEEKIKPLVIKNLHMFNIEGTLGVKESFKSRGYLEFLNTFKREMHILDIPIEIIGRIGFDLGIFVPVIGKLEFEMHQGKIFLKELKNTFSEGKRSRFYLSGYKDSYIGLDGELFIDIKMKQYVLLKFTEPFTLSIRGSVTKPKYSLR